MYNLIKQAIITKKQVIADYDGFHRELCPHILWRWKDWQYMCLFYQFWGQSSRGNIISDSPSNRRCIEISKLTNVSLRDWVWHSMSKYSKEQTCVKIVDVEIKV